MKVEKLLVTHLDGGMEKSDYYQICWTCRGLFPPTFNHSTTLQVSDHIKKCGHLYPTDTLPSFQHYVCDRVDFVVMTQLKKCLTTSISTIISKRQKDLHAMGFSQELMDLLIGFGGMELQKPNCTAGWGNSIITTQNNKSSSTKEDETRSHFGSTGCLLVNDAIEIDDCINMEIKGLLTEEEQDKLNNQCTILKNGNIYEWTCKLCDFRIKSSKLMIRHLNTHNNGKSFVCQNCNFSTLTRSKWTKHQCRNFENKHLLCVICTQSFSGKVALKHHLATKHKESVNGGTAKVFECKECSYVGRNMSSLIDHQRKHTGDYLFCDQPNCTFKTPYKRSLQQHLQQKHAAEKDQVCHVCGFRTKHVRSLRKHMKLHGEGKRYKCDQCSFSSHNSSDVVLHVQRKHLKEKKLSCSQCSFKTGYPMALKNHVARHELVQNNVLTSNSKPRKRVQKVKQQHLCPFCFEVFNTAAKMKKHMNLCGQSSLQDSAILKNDDDAVCKVFNEREDYFDTQLDVDMSAEVYSITSNMLSEDASRKSPFTRIVVDPLDTDQLRGEMHYGGKDEPQSVTTCKGRNPMLAESTRTLAAERDSPLLGESLFDLMLDFPRPPTLNRCQSASTLMFASLSPHLVDRPLTPDFFSDNPANSFFSSLT